MDNKKGYTTLWILIGILVAVLVVTGAGLLSFVVDKVDTPLSAIDFCVNTSSTPFDNYSCFHNQYAEKITPVVSTVETTAVKIVSTGIVIGLILVMSFIGWVSPKKNRIWAAFDIFVIIFFTIAAVIISNQFDTYIHSNADLLAIYSGSNLSLGSTAILNLHILVAILGIFIMIIDYSTAKKEDPIGGVYGY